MAEVRKETLRLIEAVALLQPDRPMNNGRPLRLTTLDKLARLNRQWTRQKLAPDFSDADFVGENEGLKKADIVDVYGALDILVAALDANNSEQWKNLYKVVHNLC